jgi:AbrB family looped-hinge helix DNA binding protein
MTRNKNDFDTARQRTGAAVLTLGGTRPVVLCGAMEGLGRLTVLLEEFMVRIMKITTKGQVTIPQDVREEFGLLPNTEVEFVRDGRGGVRLQKSAKSGARGAALIAELRGKWRSRLTTDEVMRQTRGES